MLDDIVKGFCLFAMQISSNMAKISLSFESNRIGLRVYDFNPCMYSKSSLVHAHTQRVEVQSERPLSVSEDFKWLEGE